MKTAEIRARFLEFFKDRGHTIVPSAPLVPANDPTLLFTNSGMVQFKNVFLGSEKLPYVRAADVQRCLRAGGKHNDLDSVGYTARHHTFFEMLGNWSFSDYFKKEAIEWAWELLTKTFGLPPDRLWVTVYHTDDEAHSIWKDVIGVPPERIVRIGDNKGAPFASDNFWQMADTGPCGPCSEIFYDHGADVVGGPPGSPDEDGDRYIEIWNLVFMQFDRAEDGTLSPLPAPCVDTGMGLERLAAVLQHVHSNYEIDLFQRLIAAAQKLTGCKDHENKSLRVIADHIRACAFLIVDGVLPSNEGRGYVLRRIIRRAVRHFYKLSGISWDGYFWKMVQSLVDEMSGAYPELKTKQAFVEEVLRAEEKAFVQTLDSGMMRLESFLYQNDGKLSGENLFLLHDTYGCPPDLIADVVREKGVAISPEAFTRYGRLMEAQRERARAASKFESKAQLPADVASRLSPTQFLGYEDLEATGCKVAAILRDGRAVDALAPGESAAIILDRTPFYAESGGQVGDTGALEFASGRFIVSDTQKFGGQFHGHLGEWKGSEPLRVGESALARVDAARRQATVLNHSATHLLHAALRETLGEHVTQKGSLVAPDRLRFDFSHFQPVKPEELRRIEERVNQQIRRNDAAEIRQMAYDEAIATGAMALFGEKYGDEVRVLRMGDFSTELCGGTHVSRTGDIGLFKIVSESGVAAGIRRIEALTGAGATAHVAEEERRLAHVAGMLSSSAGDVADKLRQLLDKQKKLERELDALKAKTAGAATGDLAAHAQDVGGFKLIAARVEGMDAKALREAVDTLKQKLGDCVVVLASASDGKAALVGGVHGAALGKVKAGDVVAHVAKEIGGKGGGRPDMAQGGGVDSPALDQALKGLRDWLATALA
ncbi:MAG TPA: alanine--tRNA ligase [Rhodanobacteraceae bacterium]|nr:alanine--tRNA ligase [Rhodanobacteraceae bacterium]